MTGFQLSANRRMQGGYYNCRRKMADRPFMVQTVCDTAATNSDMRLAAVELGSFKKIA
jgi:hypothetical protein